MSCNIHIKIFTRIKNISYKYTMIYFCLFHFDFHAFEFEFTIYLHACRWQLKQDIILIFSKVIINKTGKLSFKRWPIYQTKQTQLCKCQPLRAVYWIPIAIYHLLKLLFTMKPKCLFNVDLWEYWVIIHKWRLSHGWILFKLCTWSTVLCTLQWNCIK